MSWSSMWIASLLLVSACGGSFKSGGQGPGGAGGGESGASGSAHSGGISGDSSAAGSVSSGGSAAGALSGGANAGGASGGADIGGASSAGTGGKVLREPTQHRPVALACGTRPTPVPTGSGGSAAGAPLPLPICTTNGECTAGANGRCISSRIGMTCSYDACFADADCAPGSVCQCGPENGPGNHCSQPGCQVDADCPNSWCSPTFSSCGNYSGVVSYACHTAKDECVNDADCSGHGATGGLGAYCMYDPQVARWVCSSSQCAG
jgi:hypothetical protein